MKHSIYYYIGLLLLPSAAILCFLEFIWKLNEDSAVNIIDNASTKEHYFYYAGSLGWFVGLGEKKLENQEEHP